MALDMEAQKLEMEKQLKGVSWTQKKQVLRQFEDIEKTKKQEKAVDPKHIIKSEYRQGKLSAFATADLLRLYEVMEQAGSISELQVQNRRRIKQLNENLDLAQKERKGKLLKKRDFESYERKKREQLFSWQKKTLQPTEKKSLRDVLMKQQVEQPLDNMIGFKQRADQNDLRKWEKNLNINNDALTTQCNFFK